jgi:asparagine synthase (glutamine-hydrolysing)
MSGICGIVDLSKQGRADPALARCMAAALRHRGPDGANFYELPDMALGVQYCKIIGGAAQPFANEDRTIVLVHDGEVLNYRELREALKRRNHIFQTDGSGETLAHLYEEYGLNLFAHLRGAVAFALWDGQAGRLVLAADLVGLRPLYLHERSGRLLFASEIKALLAAPDMPRALDLEALDTYLGLGYMIGERTLFQGVRRLPPGHALVIEPDGAPRLHPFWRFGAAAPAGRGQETLIVQECRDLLADSVRLHLRSDAPLGLLLDGGLDSAALLALAARESAPRTFALAGNAESADRARQLAARFKSDHHEIRFSPADWWRALEQAVYHLDEPVASPQAADLLLLAEGAASTVKSVLSGSGGAVLFGGYAAHYAIPAHISRRQPWGAFVTPTDAALPENPRGLPGFARRTASKADALAAMQSFDDGIFTDGHRAALYSPELRAAWQSARHRERAYAALIETGWRDDPYDTAQALILQSWLPGNLLLRLDRAVSAAALEARVPFFDPPLLKFAAGVPPSVRLRTPNHVLREAARPLLPDFALQTPPTPAHPAYAWLAGELSAQARAALTDPNGFIYGLFDRAALEKLLKDHFWGRSPQPEVIFRLLVLELWAQRFIKPAVFAP